MRLIDADAYEKEIKKNLPLYLRDNPAIANWFMDELHGMPTMPAITTKHLYNLIARYAKRNKIDEIKAVTFVIEKFEEYLKESEGAE